VCFVFLECFAFWSSCLLNIVVYVFEEKENLS
jgi:hypothetical protein